MTLSPPDLGLVRPGGYLRPRRAALLANEERPRRGHREGHRQGLPRALSGEITRRRNPMCADVRCSRNLQLPVFPGSPISMGWIRYFSDKMARACGSNAY